MKIGLSFIFFLGFTLGSFYYIIQAQNQISKRVDIQQDKKTIDQLIDFYSKDLLKYHKKPKALLTAIIERENKSRDNEATKNDSHKFGRKGKRNPELYTSYGQMQILGVNARNLGISIPELKDPEINIQTGTYLLSKCFEYERGHLIRALACNNQGPEKQYSPRAVEYAIWIVKKTDELIRSKKA